MNLLVRELVKATGGRLLSGFPDQLCGVPSIDSRTLKPGEIFFALRGPRFDGHDFIGTAVRKNAQSLVIQTLDKRFHFDWPAVSAPDVIQVEDTLKALQDSARYVRSKTAAMVIGVTGSNGKTTTKEMLFAILKRAGPTLATRGNLNNHIGLPLTVCGLEPHHRYAVIEMGTSQKGDMELLRDIARPQVGLITNVGKDHLEFFGSPEGVLADNRLLLDGLPKDGIAVINMDDPLLRPLASQLHCKTVTYGTSSEATIRATDIQARPAPLKFTLHLGKQSYLISLNVPGTVQVLNATAAAAVAYSLDIRPAEIIAGLQAFKPVSMRWEAQERPDGVILINDAYNANPSSVRASVESFCASYQNQPRWVVLGDMRELGEVSRREHEALGQWLTTQPIERIFLYGRDTRFVEASARAAGAGERVERFRKKRYLIETLQLLLCAQKPAILFKASRKLQLEQVVRPLL